MTPGGLPATHSGGPGGLPAAPSNLTPAAGRLRTMNRVAIPLAPSIGLSAATTGTAALGAAGVIGASVAGPVTCLFSAVTGLPCPFCGLTHGVAQLGAGHFETAVALNPLAPLAALLALAVPVTLLRGRTLTMPPAAIVALAAIVLLTWITRIAT